MVIALEPGRRIVAAIRSFDRSVRLPLWLGRADDVAIGRHEESLSLEADAQAAELIRDEVYASVASFK